MAIPHVNSLAVLVAGIVILAPGGLWHSPPLFAKRWMALRGATSFGSCVFSA